MKGSVRIAFLSLTIALGAMTASVNGQPLVWSDEFDGDSIDPTKWTFDVGGSGFGNGELQFYTNRNKNVYVENGELVIHAERELYEGKEFSSARLKSHGRVGIRYGRIEARIRVPDLEDGLWPAFWLLGDNIGQVGWPLCGEIDILEMGSGDAITAGMTNRRVGAAAHWDYQGNYALYSNHVDSPIDLSNDYHIYRLDWTPTQIQARLDGVPFWTFDISDIAGSSLEEFHSPHFLVLNLAVGGFNFVNITDPNLITAPFPGELHVDYIRVYENGFTEVTVADDTAEKGQFGILTESVPMNGSLTYGLDADLFIWNNMTATGGTPYEGGAAWNFSMGAGSWFGMGAALQENRNMQHYSNGDLHLHMKTSSAHTFGLGIASAAGGEGWVDLVAGGEEYGLVRDGQWHEVIIPLNKFPNIDFHTISQMFMFKGEAPSENINIAIDNVYWTPSRPLAAPENGNFAIYSDTPSDKTAGEFVLGVDGEFYVWENTLNAVTTPPYEGAGAIGLESAPGIVWFGAAFTPNEPLNLTAFDQPGSMLRFAMKTTSTAPFRIGMKGGPIPDLGQEWITFRDGQDPYGFVRDGQWHVVEIPMSDLSGVDLRQVVQLFELLGTEGPITDIAIDGIALINGGTATIDDGAGAPTANAGADQVITLPTSSVMLSGSSQDPNGTIVSHSWSQISGPTMSSLSGQFTPNLTASGLAQGTYVFQLVVTDDEGLHASDTATVLVATPAPTADAGPDITIDLPVNTATLFGSGWDSDGTIVGYSWAQLVGPSTATLGGATTATLVASDLVEGAYVFELTVTDNDNLMGTDTAVVIVNDPPENIALGKVSVASSEENPGLGAVYANDGMAATRWASAQSDPQWIEIDLADTYDITQVVLIWEFASGKTYDIDVSDNGTDWTTIYSTTAGAGGTEDLGVSGTGRYIRMYGTERNTPYGYSLFEFEVYGSLANTETTPGDIDNDGDLDDMDIQLMSQILLGNELNPDYLLRADMNDDGLNDGSDLQMFIDALLD